MIVHGLSPGPSARRPTPADITYGTNNEFGFDYLRDNLVYDAGEMVQRGHNFAIVDEVDSILIDEARTPLIISGPTEDRSEFYQTIDLLVKELIKDPTTYDFDEKQRQVILTEDGSEQIEEMLLAGGHLAAGYRRPLRRGQRLGGAPREPGAARQRALPAATRTTSSAPAR